MACLAQFDSLPPSIQVCVQQTTLDLLAKGYDVHILADACSSRTQVDRIFALEVSLLLFSFHS